MARCASASYLKISSGEMAAMLLPNSKLSLATCSAVKLGAIARSPSVEMTGVAPAATPATTPAGPDPDPEAVVDIIDRMRSGAKVVCKSLSLLDSEQIPSIILERYGYERTLAYEQGRVLSTLLLVESSPDSFCRHRYATHKIFLRIR